MPSYSLDGVPLDHPAGCWRTKKGTQRRPLPGARAVKVSVPGRHGDIPVVGLDLEATTFGLTFKVASATPSGADGGYEQMERNLEALSALLGTRHRLMKLRYQAGNLVRVADVTITAASEPEVNTGAATARLTAVVEVPGALWRDESESTWTGAPNQLAQPVTTLANSTGPITDALLRFTGPAVQPSIGDVATGGWALRPGGLLAGERLLIDCGRMQAAVVTTDTWDLAAGNDVTGEIDAIGPGSQFRWLHLTPSVAVADPFSRAVLVSTSATGTGASSKAEIQAKRAFL
ncbi:phage tail family protein [Nonomuraea sp. NEAU-A123]|uniref:phage tail family protein n=1 Tax=Nonomuraea sp. NEAU-A123 TaxID=2839649 RepID=UPI001BE4A775|nr:phage tail family protein [Nonomuraea sp. NEAU-A123]MBT2234750.1 hypothetical protein [Nonomuraea sp. NEAU-A123]